MKSHIFLLIIFFSLPAFSQSNLIQFGSRIDSVLSNSFFDTTQIAVDVYDLTAKESLYNKNEKFLMRPASNMKILTTAAALVFLGPEYNFKTSLCYTGNIKHGILSGDLYVIGGCDPEFNINQLDSLAAILKAAGINEIKGNLVGDVSMMDTLYWGEGWMWDDDCASLTPLNINENLIGVVVKPGEVGQKAIVQLVPNTGYVQLNNYSLTVSSDSPSTYKLQKDRVNRKNILSLVGNFSVKGVPDTLYTHLYEPQLYFLSLLRDALNSKGINISGKFYIANAPVYSKEISGIKKSFAGMINYINKESYNLGAEMVLRALGAESFGRPSSASKGIRMIDSLVTLANLNPGAYRLVDGSGISHYNLVSAQLLMEVLKYLYFNKSSLYEILYQSFPVSGEDGTLSYRMGGSSAAHKVHAKTGTLSGVSTLSGYVNSENGHLLAFSILLQGFTGSSKESRDYEDTICNILAEYK